MRSRLWEREMGSFRHFKTWKWKESGIERAKRGELVRPSRSKRDEMWHPTHIFFETFWECFDFARQIDSFLSYSSEFNDRSSSFVSAWFYLVFNFQFSEQQRGENEIGDIVGLGWHSRDSRFSNSFPLDPSLKSRGAISCRHETSIWMSNRP